mgnify:CR=1 FL=1
MLRRVERFHIWTTETNVQTTYGGVDAETVQAAFYDCIYADDYGINPCSKWMSVTLDNGTEQMYNTDNIVSVSTVWEEY